MAHERTEEPQESGETGEAAERARLERAYRATTYRVGSLALRVDTPTPPALDALLEGRGLDEYAYLTAVNPRSRPLPDAENRRRMAALRAALDEDGWVYLLGEAVADAALWPPEPSLLVLGLPAARAVELARAFEQNALVVGRRGGAARLVFVDDVEA